jgi:hypothetical protein
MWIHATCLLAFHIAVPTPFIFMLRPRSGWHQWVGREQYVLTPSVPAVEFTDPFGNLCQRLVASPGSFSVHTTVDIETAEVSDLAPGAPMLRCRIYPMKPYPSCFPVGFANPIASA